ncbi:hypothetical protein TNCV_2244381 [Trichonephila clavipes]|nr:hypothetical protein TNCV_2244381 [Trichonephila clavipes]
MIRRYENAIVSGVHGHSVLPHSQKIVRVHYFVRGGFVGYRSRASSKHLSPSSSCRRARFLGGQKGVALHLQAARVGVGSTKKAD